jgi:transcriptional regulator with XRE-family HTH domain
MDIFDIGDRVRTERRRRKLTQEQLGEIAGVSRVRINKIEKGTAADVRFGTLINVLNALGLDLEMTDFNAGRPTFEDLLAENERRDTSLDNDDESPGF